MTARHLPSSRPTSQAAVEAFLVPYCEPTRQVYSRELRRLSAFCGERGVTLLEADRALLEAFGAHSRDELALSAGTTRRQLSAASSFFRFALEEGWVPRNPMVLVRRPRAAPPIGRIGLDVAEARLLLRAADGDGTLSAALVRVLLFTGIRISAAVGADVDDLRRERGHLTLQVQRKGGGHMSTVVPAGAAQALSVYLRGRRAGPLFLSRTGRRLDRTNAGRRVKRLARLALPGRTDVSCHSCRHTYITLAAVDCGLPLLDVRDAAGHSSITTTMTYTTNALKLERHPSYEVAALIDNAARAVSTRVSEQKNSET